MEPRGDRPATSTTSQRNRFVGERRGRTTPTSSRSCCAPPTSTRGCASRRSTSSTPRTSRQTSWAARRASRPTSRAIYQHLGLEWQPLKASTSTPAGRTTASVHRDDPAAGGRVFEADLRAFGTNSVRLRSHWGVGCCHASAPQLSGTPMATSPSDLPRRSRRCHKDEGRRRRPRASDRGVLFDESSSLFDAGGRKERTTGGTSSGSCCSTPCGARPGASLPPARHRQ